MGRCQSCGLEAEVDDVTILRLIGVIIAFQWSRRGGVMCKRCVDREIVPATLITMFMGWWGIISFFLTPIFLAVNAWNFIKTRGLADPP